MDSANTDIFQKYVVLTRVSLHVNVVYVVPSFSFLCHSTFPGKRRV